MSHPYAHIAESRRWLTRFSLRSMTALHVSRISAPLLTPNEIATIKKSIQQFQLGEASRGQRLLTMGQEYSLDTDDPYFAQALELFIAEEQQHSRYLANFMESQGIPLLSKHWVDTAFRKLRGLAGLELSLTVLVTAEIIALPYYRALRNATGSHTLKLICGRILEDEAAHLKYQSSMLARIAIGRTAVGRRILTCLHKLFLQGTLLIVWIEHRSVLEAGGYNFGKFRDETLQEFGEWGISRRTFNFQAAPHGNASATNIVWTQLSQDSAVSNRTQKETSRI